MATLSLKISLEEGKVIKTMQFDPSTSVFDACRVVRDKIQEANLGEPKDYGIFLSSDEDNKKGVWLEPGRSLEYYMLRNGDVVEYKKKMRTLRVRMLDGTLKTMMVDDSQNVANLMVVICTKIGITNYDEYSLVRDDIKEETDTLDNKANYGTLTLKRKHAEKGERDAKMDQLRKKLRTDDEVNWIDPSKTLREQGVDEAETVLLRRKFFYSDQNIDSRDPVQLNLLYVQARDAILDGTHPVTMDKACEFAGIQCQIQFGDHKEDKHTIGFLDLKEFLPQSYVKVKGVEKKVFKEHKNHIGLSEIDSKVIYTKTARALRTYGVAFFLVKEKMKGKNKLVPRLLGVTKDSVLRLDERTKEILQTWPLTTVRRWCASPNTFTLDFGDYSDQYYSVQTTEAEQILQVIAGYIDIILKKQKAKDHFGIEGDEGSTMVEDSVSPHKATILQHETSKIGKVNTESLAKPAVMRIAEGVKPYSQGHMASAQFTTVSGQVNVGHAPPAIQQTKVSTVMSEPQRALLSTISSGQEVIRQTEIELVRAQLPELGSDPASIKWKEVTLDTNKQNVSYQIAAMNAATAQVVTLTSGPTDEVDHTAVGAAITTIASNLPEVTKGVSMIAALMEDNDNGDRLLDATRRLCSAFSDLLKATEPETKEPRQNLLNAASRVGEASTQVLHTIGEDTEETREIQDILLALAKAVANTTAALVLKAKNIAATCKDDQQAQNRVIGAATQCALATSQLVACAKVVAPTLQSPLCREQLAGACRQVASAVERLTAECERAAGSRSTADLSAAAQDVAKALDDLLNHVNADHRRARMTIHETSVESIMTATDRLCSSQGDPSEMVKQARLLGQATAELIHNIKIEAEKNPGSETQRRLLAAAKLLADATARMVEAARQCASSPHDKSKQEALCRAAEELRYVTTDYASSTPDVRRQLFKRLESAAKQAASTGTQFISSAQNVAAHNTNRHSQETLIQECRTMAENIPQLIEGVKGTIANPDDSNSQLNLINASEAFLQPGTHVIQAARAVLPTVQDQSSAMQLSNTAQQLATSCSELRSAVGRARSSCTGLELDAAAQIIRSLQRELAEVDRAARDMRLKPLPGESVESSSQDLTSSARAVNSCTARLVSAAGQSNAEYCGRAAHETAQSLARMAAASRAVVATCPPGQHPSVVDSTQDVMSYCLTLVEEAKRYLTNPESLDTSRLDSIAKNVSVALNHSVNSLPGHQDVDSTIDNINETLQILSMGEFPPTNKSYGQLQQELNVFAEGLNAASTDTVQAAVVSPRQLGETSKQFGRAYSQLLTVSMEMAGQTTDYDAQSQMVVSMKNVSRESSKLLTTAKSVSNDPSQPNVRNQLSAAARAVTDSINYLVEVCTSGAPGQKECDSAVRSIQSVRPLLQHPSEPVSDLGYYQCVDTIIEHSKTLGQSMSGMANHARDSEHEQLGKSVKTVSESICGLIECTAQAAYLVAVSDPTSVAGRPGLVDQSQFARASQVIRQACDSLVNPASNESQVLSAATFIAKHTSALCNACRVASSKTANPVAKRHFVQSAKEVANSTALLVKEIKALDSDYSESNRSRCSQATEPLLQAVSSLCQFAGSAEFVSVPARVSAQARRSQEPILDSGRKIIQGSCSMIESAKSLAVEPNDREQWSHLATHSKTVTDSIKSLVNNIRDKAPGQSECLSALDILSMQIREIDQASLMAVSQTLPVRKGNTLQGYTEQLESSANEMLDKIEPLRAAAKSEAENLGHSVNQMVSYAEPLASAAIGVASNMVESQRQQQLLDQTKTLLEGATQLLLAAKEAGGNPRATSVHPDVDEYSQGVRDAAGELLNSAETISAQRGIVSGLLDSLTRSVARITDHRMSLIGSFNEAESFVDYQTRMVGAAKEIARLATEMTAKSGTDVSKLATLAGDLTHRYNQLAQDSVGAAATTTNNDVAQRIRSTVVELGGSVITLVRAGGLCQVSRDAGAQRDVTDGSRHVSEKVGAVLSALQAGSRGTQACIDAAATISAIIGDLDTTILFASAGTLHAENENDAFADHRESILKTAKALVEDTKTLVGGAASSQEQLASAAHNAVTTIVQLSSVVKQGAMSLGSGNPDSQVMLIHAVRDVAAALRDLVQATKDASGKHIADPAMPRLKDSAKVGNDIRRNSLPNRARHQEISKGERLAIDLPGLRSNSLGPASKKRDDRKPSVSNYDSETDWFVSDQEEELIRILEDSSQDEVENYEEQFEELIGKKSMGSGVSLNSGYTQWSYKNAPEDNTANRKVLKVGNPLWKGDMEFKILKYAQMIVSNEIKKLEEVVHKLDELEELERNETPVNMAAKFNSLKRIDVEMKNIANVLSEIESDASNRGVEKKLPMVDLQVEKRKKVVLSPVTFDDSQTGVANYLDIIRTQEEFWQMFTVEAEIWKALMLKNYERNLETKQKLDQFSGELKITDVEFERRPKLTEIQPLGSVVEVKKVMLDKSFDNVITDLEGISKRDFNYKGFDPIIEQLMKLRLLQVKRRMIEEDFDNIYSDIENSDLTFEELCKMEQHYEGIERQYRKVYEEEMKEGTLKKKLPEKKIVKDIERATQTEHVIPINFNDVVNNSRNVISNVEHRNFVTNVNTNVIRNVTVNETDNRTVQNDGRHVIQGGPLFEQGDRRIVPDHRHVIQDTQRFDQNNRHIIDDQRVTQNNRHVIQNDQYVTQNNRHVIQNDEHFTQNNRHVTQNDQRFDQNTRHIVQDDQRFSQDNRHTVQDGRWSAASGGRRLVEQMQRIEDLSGKYPQQYYASNWWSIYEDVVKNRAKQFGTLDKWWSYYESGRQADKPVMVTNVTSLLKTVKAVEDEHTRGTRALEATIEAIAQEIRLLLSPGAPKLTATPEELVRCTKAITVATAKAVAAGNSAKQDDVIAAANIGRRAIGDMLAICKGAAYKCAETEELRDRTLRAGHSAATSYRELLLAVLRSVQGQAGARQAFPDLGRAVAQAAADIVAAAEALKGTDWVDPDDPTVIAENELLGAAASIDAAANKLAALRPRKSVKEADESLNFDEMILEAAKSIIAATSALVRAASAAQRELIDQGKVARRPLYSSDDGQWSEGLVSAARLAAAAAHSLAESANALVQGLGSEERLVSSAKQVASSTAQLLVACKVKADPNSESTRRLQGAGNAVIKSTDNLVRAAQRAISHEEERHLVLNTKMVGGIAQEIDARSEVLRIERELDEARGRLMAIRQAKYKLKGGDTSGDETDTEITLHSTSGNHVLNQTSPYQTNSLTRQDGSAFTSFGTNNQSYNQSNTSYNQVNTSFNQSNVSNNQVNTSYNQSTFGQQQQPSRLSSFSTIEKTKYPSPPPPNPPPPMTTNLSTFTRTTNTNVSSGGADESGKLTSPGQNYEGFTTRSPNNSNKDYETRCYETPRPLVISPDYYTTKSEEDHKTYHSSASAFSTYSKEQKYEAPRITSGLEKPKTVLASPLSPKFNAKFDLKREFESSDLSRNNYSQNVLSSVHDSKTEQMYSTVRKGDVPSPTPYIYGSKSPTSPKPFSSDSMRMESYQKPDQSPFSTLGSNYTKSPTSPGLTNTGYSEVNQSYNFKTETTNKGQNVSQSNALATMGSLPHPKQENVQLFGKEVFNYGGPNYSQETMTEVKEIPNGTQKVTTTKIYSSTPMKITSTNMKYDSKGVAPPKFDSMNEFTREFGANESNFSTLDSNFGNDTMKSFTSQSTTSNLNDTLKGGPSFLRPSDYSGQSAFQSSSMVTKTVKTPADLAKELDSMERKLMKQTISSEVIEKKTVMTSSSKSETSSTTTKKFGNF